jgi:hypothetical protein
MGNQSAKETPERSAIRSHVSWASSKQQSCTLIVALLQHPDSSTPPAPNILPQNEHRTVVVDWDVVVEVTVVVVSDRVVEETDVVVKVALVLVVEIVVVVFVEVVFVVVVVGDVVGPAVLWQNIG